MYTFKIDQKTCVRCGLCVEICPASVIEKKPDGTVDFRSEYENICLGCGQCMAICGTKSIVAKSLSYEKNFFELHEATDFFSMLEHRRSIRQFKPEPVKKEDIEKILHSISLAPHGDSAQHVEIAIINSREKIMQILPAISGFYDKLRKWLHNPFMRKIIELRKGKATLKTLLHHLLPRIQKGIYREISFEYDGITRGAHTIMVFHAPIDAEEHVEDAFIFVAYTSIAAQALGLGATVIGLIAPAINKDRKIKKFFHIPPENEAIISLIVGYPKYKYKRGIRRELKKVEWIE